MLGPFTQPESPWWPHDGVSHPMLERDLDLETDVVIVGGGIAGLTLAFTLRERGAEVALLEAGPFASGASSRNAGFLMAAPAEPYEEAIALWGRAGARAMLETGRRSHERIRELIETLGIECGYRVRGSLRLTTGEEEREDHRRSLPLMRADGFPMDEVPLAGQVPDGAEAGFTAAFRTAEDGELDPVRFLHGVARAALDRGMWGYENSPVTGASWSDGRWEVHTPRGRARGRALVLCTNAWAPQLCAALEPIIVPMRGQMLATAPIDRTVAPLPSYAHWGYRYWRQLEDGRLLIGGWRDLDRDAETGYDTSTTPRIQRGIEEGLRLLVPEGVEIQHRWAGTMGFARDGRPLVGWLDADHHLAICAGFTGHGMGMAAACTLDLAEMLSWRETQGAASFAPARFPELRRGVEEFTALGARG